MYVYVVARGYFVATATANWLQLLICTKEHTHQLGYSTAKHLKTGGFNVLTSYNYIHVQLALYNAAARKHNPL